MKRRGPVQHTTSVEILSTAAAAAATTTTTMSRFRWRQSQKVAGARYTTN